MLREVLEALRPSAHGCYADGTVGGGGHASAILEASSPEGWLYGCDRDNQAVEAAARRLAGFEGRFELRRGSFAELLDWVGPQRCDGVVLDLGVSSAQLDQAARGFSFQLDGPLDMRMDLRQTMTAARIVNETPASELARLFWELGQERHSRRAADAICRERERQPFETTRQLASLMERLMPRRGQRLHPATRVFQALRMATNDELGLLKRGLENVWKMLKPGGRLAVIAFHSLEVRALKDFGRRLERPYLVEGEVDVPELRRPAAPQLRWVRTEAKAPSAEEIESNPRARSAQLRVMEKL